MKITCVNRSANPVPMPGAVSCAAGTTKALTGRTVDEAAQMQELYASSTVQIVCELEDDDYPPIVAVAKTPADPAADATDLAAVGFDIKDLYGNAYSTDMAMYFGVFDDEDCLIPSEDATLDTAATGTIDAGAGTNRLTVTPDAGELSVTVSIPAAADQVVYLKAWVVGGRRMVDTSDQHAATFSVS